MTLLPVNRDDEGLQRLRIQRRRQGRIPRLSPVSPYPGITARSKTRPNTRSGGTPKPAPAGTEEQRSRRSRRLRRRAGERRRGDRRQRQIPVLLDTRGRQDRRRRARRRGDSPSGWDSRA